MINDKADLLFVIPSELASEAKDLNLITRDEQNEKVSR